MNIKTQIEPISIQKTNDREIITLLSLTEEQQHIINPIVPPTSGIRMEIYDFKDNIYFMPIFRQMMFLRVFKAVSVVAKAEVKKPHPKVLMVSDDRPSASKLLEYCAKIFTHEGYEINFQQPMDPNSKQNALNDPYYSRMSTPYGSASIALYNDIDVVVVLTASHNELIWNGIKFYIQRPVPISGGVMQEVCQQALKYTQIEMAEKINPQYIDADTKNNEYILQIVQKIIDISVLKGKKIIFWPYLGQAPELQDLFKKVGVNLIVVEDDIEPPNPTAFVDEPRIKSLMIQHDVNLAILVDADRDRVVFLIRKKDKSTVISLTPNELYTAMHNILAKEFNKKIINVRTVPSDPRSDDTAACTIAAGVGYKHLGMVLYSAAHQLNDLKQFNSGIIYIDNGKNYEKVTSPEQICRALANKGVIGKDLIMVLWEESGGHTFNILNINQKDSDIEAVSQFPLIGDKYPAVAILVLCALLEMDYDLTASVDKSIIGTRTTIHANDQKKVDIVKHFAQKKGQTFEVEGRIYNISTFEQVDGVIDIIMLSSSTTKIYFRPSGTGPEVRIYVFGPSSSAKNELDAVKQKIAEIFP